MHHKTIEEISSRMAGIDIAILSTHTENGQIANRPMSNNGDVKYDGTSYYFTFEQARTVADIQANPKVALGFSGKGGIFSDAIYVAVEGSGELIRDKDAFKAHWTSDLDRWFDKGVDTPNIVLIKVKAVRITYWIASGRRIILLTVFRKRRMRETAEVERAVRAMNRCIAEAHTADEDE